MNIEDIREYCLNKKSATESLPFDENTLVFKVKNKIFAILSLGISNLTLSLKGEPANNVELREKYEFILPGYHMNKLHWNTIELRYNISASLIKQLIDNSYNIVISTLPLRLKEELNKE